MAACMPCCQLLRRVIVAIVSGTIIDNLGNLRGQCLRLTRVPSSSSCAFVGRTYHVPPGPLLKLIDSETM